MPTMKLVPEKSPLPRLLAFPLLLCAAGGAAAFRLWGPHLERLAFCPLREVAGLPCPTCGGTHVALALARLDPLAALRLNPFLAVGLAGAGLWLGYAVAATLRPAWRRSLEVGRRGARLLRIGAVALLLASWAYQVARVGIR